jgi:hypothetical protein
MGAFGCVLAAALLGGVAVPASGDAPGAPAQVIDIEFPTRVESYRYTDFGRSASPRDDHSGKAKFRVIERSGNCCENYLTIDKKGRLYDIGGRWINFTDDEGKSWKSVQPLEPLLNGEGTMTVAPGGDIVGVEWDPYSGDHLLSYKYDAQLEEWQYLEAPLHTPFYDRPWMTVVPGPFIIRGEKVPYITFVDGYPHRGPFLYSTDGITYVQTSNPFIDHKFTSATEGWLKTKPNKDMDWMLPNSASPITALGGGRALAAPGPFANTWSVLDPKTQQWSAHSFPGGAEPKGAILVDEEGRIHTFNPQGNFFDYSISSDGGRSWKTTNVVLPKEVSASGGLQSDFRINNDAGIAAVAMHARFGKTQTDGDIVYTLDITGDKARVKRLYEIGLGDIDASSGVGQNIRFDFETIAIFSDGRIAVSFLDSTTGPAYHFAEPVQDRLSPALAIEL